MKARNIIALGALSLVISGSTANAQTTYFPYNATINYAVPNPAVVGYANDNDYNNNLNGTSPTVNLVGGGSINGSMEADNSSILNIHGGSVSSTVIASNHSTINISDGSLGSYLRAYDNSVVNVSGGSIADALSAFDHSTFNLRGGTFGNVIFAAQSSTVNFFGTGLSDTLVTDNYRGFSQYSLSGSLLDGTDLTGKNLYVQNGTAAFAFNPGTSSVPEPGSGAFLVGLASVGVGFLGKRRIRISF